MRRLGDGDADAAALGIPGSGVQGLAGEYGKSSGEGRVRGSLAEDDADGERSGVRCHVEDDAIAVPYAEGPARAGAAVRPELGCRSTERPGPGEQVGPERRRRPEIGKQLVGAGR